MFKRALSTGIAVVAAVAAMLLLDCNSASVDFLPEDSLGLCATADAWGMTSSTLLVVWIGSAAAAILIMTWAPVIIQRRRMAAWDRVFIENLSRITSPSHEIEPDPAHVPSSAEREQRGTRQSGPHPAMSGQVSHRAMQLQAAHELNRSITLLQELLASDGVSTRQITRTWIGLLKEANDLHNRDALSTEDFRIVNTRLIGIFDGR